MVPRKQNERAPIVFPPASVQPVSSDPVVAADSLLTRFGLGSTTPLLMDLARPLAWFGTQALLVLEPTLELLGARPATDRLTHWLELLEQTPDRPPEEEPCR